MMVPQPPVIVSSIGGAHPVFYAMFAAWDVNREPVWLTPVANVSNGDRLVVIDSVAGRITLDYCAAIVMITRLERALDALLYPTQSLVVLPGGLQ